MAGYPMIEFHQYDSNSADDRLLMFAAPAREIWSWAGIPRKGWQVRMLYQRWITESRKQEVTSFWNEAGTERPTQPKRFLVGPTALTIAMFSEPELDGNGNILLDYEPPFEPDDNDVLKLGKAASVVLSRMRPRLESEETEILQSAEANPQDEIPNVGSNYVLESLCQIAQMASDAEFFVSRYNIEDTQLVELIQSLEALARPALVVDGQHRLYGAAHSIHPVSLPVVAMPDSPWMEQIYQFVVINEKAQRVETSLLTDIFGSSLTPSEQRIIRQQLDRSGAQVEQRIAAVVAAREEASPFYGLVRIRLEGEAPSGVTSFIPEATIRQLIEGGRGTRGWRSDDEFFQTFVQPTFPDRAVWDSWTDGRWREYWFAFWSEVRDFYNERAAKEKPPTELWGSRGQSNLTKAVTLRLLQKLFISKAIARVDDVKRTRDTLVAVLGEEQADEKLAEQIREKAIPEHIDEFRKMVRAWFLEKGVPVRVFTNTWVSSLDDAAGQQDLYDELLQAFDKAQRGERYTARNNRVYAVGGRNEAEDT
jgi:hypothetical protein